MGDESPRLGGEARKARERGAEASLQANGSNVGQSS